MSERMGFTSNYIYDIEDYKRLRKRFEVYKNLYPALKDSFKSLNSK